jgi:hypothetical protein
MKTIYRKTAKGTEAIANRQSGLGPRHRSLLIMIDGKRSVAELAPVGSALGDVADLIQALQAEGLIEAVNAAAPAAAGAPGAEAAEAPPRVTLSQAQRHAVRLLNDLLGPGGADLCMRVESTRSAQEFRAVLKRAEQVVRDGLGARKAERFIEEMESLRAT